MKKPPLSASPTGSLEHNPIARTGFRSGIFQAQRSSFDLSVPQASSVLLCAGLTVQGERTNNEDAIAFLIGKDSRARDLALFLVLDGMGGHLAGEVASRYAALQVMDNLASGKAAHLAPNIFLEHAIRQASSALSLLSKLKPETSDMGTTLVAALFLDGSLYIAHSGDSSLYRHRHGEHIERLTHPHPLAYALGGEELTKIEVQDLGPITADTRLVLCTDGLNCPPHEIETHIMKHTPQKGCEALVSSALWEFDSTDNVSVLVIECVDLGRA